MIYEPKQGAYGWLKECWRTFTTRVLLPFWVKGSNITTGQVQPCLQKSEEPLPSSSSRVFGGLQESEEQCLHTTQLKQKSGLRLPNKRSLRVRVCFFFSAFLLVTWGTAAYWTWEECTEAVNTLFDTHQVLLAKKLAVMPLGDHAGAIASDVQYPLPYAGWEPGEFDDDALSFAIFTRDGVLVLHDGSKGNNISFRPDDSGFATTFIKDEPWRILWMDSPDGKYRVAVGQELDFRHDAIFDMLWEQLTPWALLVPVLLFGVILILTIELFPLRKIANTLSLRAPDDITPISHKGLPSEVTPLVSSLNALFTRTGDMVKREREFISLAAHELRTPLTAIRVQADVARLQGISEAKRQVALKKLTQGLDQASKMLEQLLALSRMDSMSDDAKKHVLEQSSLDWPVLVHEAAHYWQPKMDRKKISLTLSCVPAMPPMLGNADFGALLLRNLFDNAIRYTKEGGAIAITLREQSLVFWNSQSVDAAYENRLGERFFRPPGQKQRGSGLGLSIVRQIAGLHGYACHFGNARGGFEVVLLFSKKNVGSVVK